MGENIRVKLLFSSAFKSILYVKSRKFWISVNKKLKFKDWIENITDKFFKNQSKNIILSHEGCAFPSWESCEILRENDLIYVDIDDTMAESNILSPDISRNSLNIEDDIVLSSSNNTKKRKINYCNNEISKSKMPKSSIEKPCNIKLHNDENFIADNKYSMKKSNYHEIKEKQKVTPKSSPELVKIKSNVFNMNNFSLKSNLMNDEQMDENKIKRKRRHLRKKKDSNKKNDKYFDFTGPNKKIINTTNLESRSIDTKYQKNINDNIVLNTNCYSGKRYVFNESNNSSPIESLVADNKIYTNLNNELICQSNNQLEKHRNLNNELFDKSNNYNKTNQTSDYLDKYGENNYHQIKPAEDDYFENNDTYNYQHANKPFDKEKSKVITESNYNKNKKKLRPKKNTKKNQNSFENVMVFKRDHKISSGFNSSEGENLLSNQENIKKNYIVNEIKNNYINNKVNDKDNIDDDQVCKKNNVLNIINNDFSNTDMIISNNNTTIKVNHNGVILNNQNNTNYYKNTTDTSDNMNSIGENSVQNNTNVKDMNSQINDNSNKLKETVKNYEDYPILFDPPLNGSVIAFKMLEIGNNYCPHVSQYKEAKVVDYIPDFKEIILEILLVNASEGESSDKFEVTVEDEDTILTNDNRMKENQKVNLCWTSLIQPRLII